MPTDHPTPADHPMPGSSTHLDRPALAELDEGLLGAAAAAHARLHLAGCPECRERLAWVAGVRAALAAAPAEPLPESVGARLDAALKAAGRPAAVTVHREVAPRAPRRRWRPNGEWLAAGAAASIVLLLVGALVLGGNKGGSNNTSTSADGSARGRSGDTAGGGVVTSGRNYTATTLAAAVPALVAGRVSVPLAAADSRAAAAAPGAGLGRPGALEPCVAELAGRSGVRPLAVDLARFAGKPAAVIVLPETGQPSTLDIWVVGPGCSRGDPQLIYFTRLPRPAGIRSP